jgi:plastocyanin
MDRLDRARKRASTRPAPPVRRRHLPCLAASTLVAALVLAPVPASSIGARVAEVRSAEAVAAATVPVSMGDDFFSPRSLSIATGDTVVWTNNGDDDHTATATNNAFHSGTMAPGDTFQRTFSTAGTYDYVCAFHDDMTGTVTVTGSTTPPPPVVRVTSFGPNPFRLAGTGRFRAVYRVGQASTVAARVVSVATGRAAYAYANRSTTGAAQLTYYWDGKNARRVNVSPGRYRFVTTVTDRQNRRVVSRKEFRVVR